MNPILVALRGKKLMPLLRRAVRIPHRYGITPRRMERALARYVSVLHQFGASASFPVTALVLERNPEIFAQYHKQGIEFAIHGYRHIDHSQLSQEEQMAQIKLAKDVFSQASIEVRGFRAPYLRRNDETLATLRQLGLAYDASQGLFWDVLDGRGTREYDHVLDFYRARPARGYPSLPSLKDGLVCIPYGLPDDEALVERLTLDTSHEKADIWLSILRRTHHLGELFTLGLHPERADLCLEPLRAVLATADSLSPSVWVARLDEITAWWRDRTAAAVEVQETDDGALCLSVMGPQGTTVLARGVDIAQASEPWADEYIQVTDTTSLTIRCEQRPFIGVSPGSPPKVASFLRQQGYIVEVTTERQACTFYVDDTDFAVEDESSLLSQIENGRFALVRLGRWPRGTRSALAISGDIDALTIWDYGLRPFGK
jgi:hypothetical protein